MIEPATHHIVDENIDIGILDTVYQPNKIVCTLAHKMYGTIHLVPNNNNQKLIWRRRWFFDEEGDKKIKWSREVIGIRTVYAIQTYEVSSYVDKDQEIWYFWKHMVHAMNTKGWCGLVIDNKIGVDAGGSQKCSQKCSQKFSLVDAGGMVIFDAVFPQHVAEVM
jgi:hypothetical protein